ncbi:hypothetical protein [Photobacterium leiognathi]|uniref:hypothetical protein n=1 Tax=Photobacterium leiognathi TaxID=553611 RepID=UPI00298187D5|nr:hypothetical protein [Photobacterium leiognathi]
MGLFDFISDIKDSVVDFIDEASGEADKRRSRWRIETQQAAKDMRREVTIKAFELWILNKVSLSENVIVTEYNLLKGIKELHDIYRDVDPSKNLQIRSFFPIDFDLKTYFENLSFDNIDENCLNVYDDKLYSIIDEQFPYPRDLTYYAKNDRYLIHLNNIMLAKLALPSNEIKKWKSYYNVKRDFYK